MKTLLKITVVLDESDGKATVRLGIPDPHIASCPTCLALYGLRVASAFHSAVEEMGQGDPDDAAESERHPLH
jgi:hypothetical protein